MVNLLDGEISRANPLQPRKKPGSICAMVKRNDRVERADDESSDRSTIGMRDRDLPTRVPFLQNHTRVIWGEENGASLHPLAGAGPLSGVRPGGLLPGEGRFLPGSQADLCRVSRPHRMPELRPPARRALRGVGRYERTGETTPEAHGVLTRERG